MGDKLDIKRECLKISVGQGFQKAPTTNEMRRLHCSEKSGTFSSEEEATTLNNVMYKNIM